MSKPALNVQRLRSLAGPSQCLDGTVANAQPAYQQCLSRPVSRLEAGDLLNIRRGRRQDPHGECIEISGTSIRDLFDVNPV